MTAKYTDETEAPFGARKRDWTMLYRAIVIGLSVFSAGAISIAFYAGSAFIRTEAENAVAAGVRPVEVRFRSLEELPPRLNRIEEISKDRSKYLDDIAVWRRSKDEIDTRLTIILDNQQQQLNRQQTLLEQMAARMPR